MTPLIQLKAASKVYGGRRPIEALHPTTLTIDRGEGVAIQGPSGAGKSTLLNLIGLLDRPTDGGYLFDDVATEALVESMRATLRAFRVGFVFQAYHLVAHRNAVDNVAMPLAIRRIGRADRRAMAEDALQRVGLAHRRDAPPDELSGGERQRVAIARAIVGHPDVLLCDEPTGNLDSRTADVILDLLQSFVADGTTVVTVTHDQRVARRATRRLLVIDGRVTDDR